MATLYCRTAAATLPHRAAFERAPSSALLVSTTLKLLHNLHSVFVHLLNLPVILKNILLAAVNACTPFSIPHGPLVLATPVYNRVLEVDGVPIATHSGLAIHFVLSLLFVLRHAAELAFYLAHHAALVPYLYVDGVLHTLTTTDYELVHMAVYAKALDYLSPPQPLPPSLSILFTPPPPRVPTPRIEHEPTEEELDREDYFEWVLSIPPALPIGERLRQIRRAPVVKLYRTARRIKRTFVKPECVPNEIKFYPEPWCSQEEIQAEARAIQLEYDTKRRLRNEQRVQRRVRDAVRNYEMTERLKEEMECIHGDTLQA